MKKNKKAPNPISFAKTVLRGRFRMWYAYNQAYKNANISRGVYQCAGCKNLFKKHELEIDHIDPVVDVETGFDNLHDWVMRLFVEPEKLQALCCIRVKGEDGKEEKFGCHPAKTANEAAMRKFHRDAKKPPKKTKKKK